MGSPGLRGNVWGKRGLLSVSGQDKEPVPWEFPSSLAFSRMNSFFHRIQTIEVKGKCG